MGWEIFFCFGILILVLGGLIYNRPPDVLFLGAVVILAVVRIITPEEALAGFVNTSMLTVGALYVIAAAMRETGALDAAGSWLLKGARSERAVLTRMAGSLPAMSAFLDNTPIVAMFIPILSGWCKKAQNCSFTTAAAPFLSFHYWRNVHLDRHQHKPCCEWIDGRDISIQSRAKSGLIPYGFFRTGLCRFAVNESKSGK